MIRCPIQYQQTHRILPNGNQENGANEVKIGWVGVHAEGISALESVCAAGYDVMGFVTLRQEKADRRCGSGSYENICQQFQIPIHEIDHINDASTVQLLKSWECDLLVVLGWGQILSAEVLQTARIGAVGAHAALLPHNRGSAPINWAIINGESETGNSLMWLAEGVDAGDLINQQAFPITAFDTCGTLYDRVAETNRDMVLDLLTKLTAGESCGTPQQHTDALILPRRRPKDGLINWNSPSKEIYNLVRAVTRPYPGAFGELLGNTYKIWKVAQLPIGKTSASAGTILGPVVSPEDSACGLLVATADGVILVLEIEDEQGNVISGKTLSQQDGIPQPQTTAA